jgi:hypothetical protein
MQLSIPQFTQNARLFSAFLICFMAVAIFFLPAGAARINHEDGSSTLSSASPAAAFVVNDNGDAADVNPGNGSCDTNAAAGDQCTLRAAIQEANAIFGNDTITFSLVPGSTITLNTALPDIAGNLTITGPGSSLLTVMRSAVGGTPNFRIFKINNSQISMSGLTVTNGRTADGIPGGGFAPGYGGPGDYGGGIYSSGSLTLTDVVVTGNRTGDGGAGTSGTGGFGGFGGGIYVHNSGSLTMTNVTVSNNIAGNGATGFFGGSGGRGGGIFFLGSTLTMTNCVVSGNTAGDGVSGTSGGSSGSGGDGGGIEAEPTPGTAGSTLILTNLVINGNHAGNGAQPISSTGGHGGAILTFPGVTTTMTNCSVSNNNAGLGGTGFSSQGGLGGGIINFGPMTLIGCTISGNFTQGPSNGGGSSGGGIFNNNILTMTNSTVSGNRTDLNVGRGGGIYNNGGTITLTNCTVTANSTNTGFESGRGVHSSGTANIKNTIIAGNGSGGPDVSGPYTSQGNNLIGATDPDSSGFTNGNNGDQVGSTASPIDPLLGPLADNGGFTQTHALLPGSTACDAGNNALITSPPFSGPPFTDQRGTGFNRIVDGPDVDTTATVDIGAFEKQTTFPDLADTSGNEDTTIIVAFEVLDSGSITSVTATSSNTTLVPNDSANINVSGSGANRIVTINPTANLSGTTDITVTINRTGGSENKTFTLTINAVNDPPSFTKGDDQSVNENSGAQTVNNWATNISAGPADESGQTLAFQIVSNNNPGLFSVAPAISSGGTLTYTPTPGASGSALISVALMDNGGTTNGGQDTSAPQTFTINVLEGGTLQFSSSSYSVNEGSSSIIITVSRFNGSAGEARVDYSTSDGSATAGADYTASSGTLIFPAGVTTQTFTVSILDDLLDETTEVIGLHLTNAAGAGSIGVPTDSQLLIIDDDPTPSLRINDVAVTEGDVGTVDAVFTVTLSAASSFTVTANFTTADSTAGASSDYQHAIGQVIFSPGDISKTISVTVNGDTNPEVHESFFVLLSNPTAAFLTDATGIGTILSDDAPGGTFAFNVLHDNVDENDGFATIVINRAGPTANAVTVNYTTFDGNASSVPCATLSALASARCDFNSALGTLRFAAGETSKSFVILINQDIFVETPESLTITVSNPTGGAVLGGATSALSGSLTIFDDASEPSSNPIDDANNFVRQHYHDFLNREADAGGLAYWTNQILTCEDNAQCIEIKRINVSAAFYLSIEFQETGYLVERLYKVSYGDALGTSVLGGVHQFPVPVIRLNEFLGDTQEIGLGVVVGTPGWELAVENNKQLFFERFVQRLRFSSAFPTTMTASQFVDKLNLNAGGVLLPAERIALINDLSTGAKTRAQVVRTIAEDSDLAIAERNRAFVLMQYFGYLRRNPNDNPDSDHTGYEFWLNKLNQFAGNFVHAEMVKAFLVSFEYRQRFAP